jgi:hypothetical protein
MNKFTGGKIKPAGAKTPAYGDWNPNLVRRIYINIWSCAQFCLKIFVVWTLSGISYGMVELIRRVMCVSLSLGNTEFNQMYFSPADIVGGNVSKLRRLDATVHIFYEVAGTAGAFASSSAISRFGNNYSFFLTPVFFTFAGVSFLKCCSIC